MPGDLSEAEAQTRLSGGDEAVTPFGGDDAAAQ
jgi:hypothetical protein